MSKLLFKKGDSVIVAGGVYAGRIGTIIKVPKGKRSMYQVELSKKVVICGNKLDYSEHELSGV